MFRRLIFAILILIVCAAFILALTRGRRKSANSVAQKQTPTDIPVSVDTIIPTNTAIPTAIRIPTDTPTHKPSPTPTATPTHTNTPTVTPTPTNTPIPSEQIAVGHRAFHNGLYVDAQMAFNALLSDPNTNSDERRLALYWRGRSELASNQYNTANITFDLFIEQYPDDDLTGPAYFNQALALEYLGLYTETIAAYQASFSPIDPIAPYVYERMGDLALAQQDFETAVAWYTAALNSTEDTSFQVHLREGIATAYLGLEQFDQTIAQYESILDVSRIPAYRAKIIRLKGEAYLVAGQEDLAREQFQQNLDLYPDLYESYLSLVTMVNADMAVDVFQRGYTDYYGGNAFQPAIDAFQQYLAASPETRADEALWIMAFSWRALGEFEKAIDTFDRLIQTHPDSPFWADAHLQKARTMGWQADMAEAIRHYREFMATYPDHSLSPDAAWRASLLEFRDEQFGDAYRNFRGVAQRYPASPFADDALYWGGLAAYQNETFVEAEAIWADLLTNYPTSEWARAASFWQAKALLALNQQDKAREILVQLSNQAFNYYGLRARDILLAENPLAAPASDPPLNLDPPHPDGQAEAEAWLASWLGLSQTARLSNLDRQILGDPAFIRAEALHTYGFTNEALDQYEVVKDKWQDNPLALYQLSLVFRERGAYRLSILSAQRLVQLSPATDPATIPTFIHRLIYPTYYQDLIIPQAEAQNLDPTLMFALIRQESLFDATAQSVADARGLMQIIPLTGADIAERTQTIDYTPGSLWNPDRNIKFGAWYLRQMLDFVDGDQFAALAAYNAGPGSVQSWSPIPDDLDIFVALIPFSESQEYIRRIYLNLANYREIYKSPS